MPRLAQFDTRSLGELAGKQKGIIGRSQALECSMSQGAIRHRIRPNGPWQVVLPGVYAVSQGQLTTRQRTFAAFLYAGRALAVTGSAALELYQIPAPKSDLIDVLVPRDCRRVDAGFARLHRTCVSPVTLFQDGLLKYAYPARAVADAVRQFTQMEDVRAVVAAGVQRGRVQVWELEQELRAGPVRGSARLRSALAEVADGVRSIAEGDLRALIKKSRLPDPLYNADLFVGGKFLACPDAWWPDFGVAAEVESKAYHLSPASWEKTLARQARMAAQGIQVIPIPPQRIRTEGWNVAREIRSALDRSHGPLPHITTVRAAA
jgi:hypothetical protein